MAVKLARQLMNNDEEEDEEDAKDKDAKFDENLPDATEDNTEGEKCDDEPDNNVNMDSCTSMDTKDSNDDIFASPWWVLKVFSFLTSRSKRDPTFSLYALVDSLFRVPIRMCIFLPSTSPSLCS